MMTIPGLIKMRSRLQEMLWDIEAELRHRLQDICINCTRQTLCYNYNFGMYSPDLTDPDKDNCLNFSSKWQNTEIKDG